MRDWLKKISNPDIGIEVLHIDMGEIDGKWVSKFEVNGEEMLSCYTHTRPFPITSRDRLRFDIDFLGERDLDARHWEFSKC